MSMLQVRNLQKTYGKGTKIVRALDDITFSVEGGVFGLLGHNDAGKTSLMKILATIVKPTSGQVSVCGFDTQKEGDEVRKLIGYLPQALLQKTCLAVRYRPAPLNIVHPKYPYVSSN